MHELFSTYMHATSDRDQRPPLYKDHLVGSHKLSITVTLETWLLYRGGLLIEVGGTLGLDGFWDLSYWLAYKR